MAKVRFTKENAKKMGSKGGKKSKRPPLDVEWRDKLQEIKKIDGKEIKLLDVLFAILMRNARDNNIKAIEVILDRAFGTKQLIELSIANPMINNELSPEDEAHAKKQLQHLFPKKIKK